MLGMRYEGIEALRCRAVTTAIENARLIVGSVGVSVLANLRNQDQNTDHTRL